MENIKLSEKEIAIFNGLISLIRKGTNPYTIKVIDIANAADVGKGTIYDYFSSKEEAISKAIIYNINHEIIRGYERVSIKDSFKDKFYEILHIIVDNIENNLSTINILLSSGGIQEFYEFIVDDKYDLAKCINIINDIIGELLDTGFQEKIIGTKEGIYYQRMSVMSAVSGFSHYISKKGFYHDTKVEEAMDVAYRQVLKMLN